MRHASHATDSFCLTPLLSSFCCNNMTTPSPPKLDLQKMQEAYKKSTNRQFFLDYDGTLAPIVEKPENAKPSEGSPPSCDDM